MVARSITATRLRTFAAAIAPFCPAGPLPITTRSYSATATMEASHSQLLRHHWPPPLAGLRVLRTLIPLKTQSTKRDARTNEIANLDRPCLRSPLERPFRHGKEAKNHQFFDIAGQSRLD